MAAPLQAGGSDHRSCQEKVRRNLNCSARWKITSAWFLTPIEAEDRSPGYWLKFRTLSIVNHNKLEGFPLPARFMWTEPIYLVRPDEQWIKAFGHTHGLIPSANGNNGTHGNEAKGPAVYPEVMKTHGHVVIEKVEFETPFSETWPHASRSAVPDRREIGRKGNAGQVEGRSRHGLGAGRCPKPTRFMSTGSGRKRLPLAVATLKHCEAQSSRSLATRVFCTCAKITLMT